MEHDKKTSSKLQGPPSQSRLSLSIALLALALASSTVVLLPEAKADCNNPGDGTYDPGCDPCYSNPDGCQQQPGCDPNDCQPTWCGYSDCPDEGGDGESAHAFHLPAEYVLHL
jgi:hypothetical protein